MRPFILLSRIGQFGYEWRYALGGKLGGSVGLAALEMSHIGHLPTAAPDKAQIFRYMANFRPWPIPREPTPRQPEGHVERSP